MLIQYDGPHPEVVVDAFNQNTVITRGEPVEIPDDLAASLLEQDTWNQVVQSKPATPAPAPAETPAATDDTTKAAS